MLRIDFAESLSANEIRRALTEVAKATGDTFDYDADFTEVGQAPTIKLPEEDARRRVGNSKHLNWFIDFYPRIKREQVTHIAGNLAVKGIYAPGHRLYGGFSYLPPGTGNELQRYPFITLHMASELEIVEAKDPDPALWEHFAWQAQQHFEQGRLRLFDIVPFTPYDDIVSAGALPGLAK